MHTGLARVRIGKGDFAGLIGDGVYFPNGQTYSVSFPNFYNAELKETFPPDFIEVIGLLPSPILEKKEDISLPRPVDRVQLVGCKGACGSVWCPECYKRKGGSKRFGCRLAELNWTATRQIVLTVDLKKFNDCPKTAYETLRDKEAVSQFVYNLKRTSGIQVKDWTWVLEWHSDGAPHYHLFIETEKGKAGRIGNKILLKHWKYGLVFESFIKSNLHWKRFTDYFSANGYFDPKQKSECKDKKHQLELPEWAKNVTYRIRKTGSMVKKKTEGEEKEGELIEEREVEGLVDGHPEKNGQQGTPNGSSKTYREILGSCGNTTNCQIRRGNGNCLWKKIQIPYKCFKEYPGEYVEGEGYVVQMTNSEYYLFLALYDFDVSEIEKAA